MYPNVESGRPKRQFLKYMVLSTLGGPFQVIIRLGEIQLTKERPTRVVAESMAGNITPLTSRCSQFMLGLMKISPMPPAKGMKWEYVLGSSTSTDKFMWRNEKGEQAVSSLNLSL